MPSVTKEGIPRPGSGVTKTLKFKGFRPSLRNADTETLLLWPIQPHPFSVEPRQKPEGLSNNRKPEKIIGAKMIEGEMKFLMRWSSATDHVCSRCTPEEEFVPANSARFTCPKVVIEFYQSHIEWGEPQEIAVGGNEYKLKKVIVKLQ